LLGELGLRDLYELLELPPSTPRPELVQRTLELDAEKRLLGPVHTGWVDLMGYSLRVYGGEERRRQYDEERRRRVMEELEPQVERACAGRRRLRRAAYNELLLEARELGLGEAEAREAIAAAAAARGCRTPGEGSAPPVLLRWTLARRWGFSRRRAELAVVECQGDPSGLEELRVVGKVNGLPTGEGAADERCLGEWGPEMGPAGRVIRVKLRDWPEKLPPRAEVLCRLFGEPAEALTILDPPPAESVL
jgi:hypothetical protein